MFINFQLNFMVGWDLLYGLEWEFYGLELQAIGPNVSCCLFL